MRTPFVKIDMRETVQTQLEFPVVNKWGGRRARAGRRKRRGGVQHARRTKVNRHDPRLVTIKCARGLSSLRTPQAFRVIACTIADAHTGQFRIAHFSVQSNHVHLIVEAVDEQGLGDGMRAFVSRLAKSLNRLWSRRGSVFPERFHDVALCSLRQVRNALRYVLNNHLKHGANVRREGASVEPDAYSSAAYFDGWDDRGPEYPVGRRGSTVSSGGWKLRVGWMRRHPLIGVAEAPRCALVV